MLVGRERLVDGHALIVGLGVQRPVGVGAADGIQGDAFAVECQLHLMLFRDPVGGGPVITYEIDGEQFVALTMSRVVWAFTLGGTLPPRPAPEPPATEVAFEGLVVDTTTIELGTVRV